jgi:Dimerisation domain of Zinc Transporter
MRIQDYFVEVDVVMPANTELWRAHDLAQRLQDKIELLPNVERAFVHVDHETEHRPVRPIHFRVALSELLFSSPVGASEIRMTFSTVRAAWAVIAFVIYQRIQRSVGRDRFW